MNAIKDGIKRHKPKEDWLKWYKSLTVAHLMSHTAGFDGGGDQEAAAKMFNVSKDKLTYKHVHLHFLKTRKLLHKPGTKYKYSNHGMGLIGHIVSEISGKSYYDYTKQNVLTPLGLNHVVPNGLVVNSRDASPHKPGSFRPVAYEIKKVSKPDLGVAAGGWSASAGDLVRLMLAIDGRRNHGDILLY